MSSTGTDNPRIVQRLIRKLSAAPPGTNNKEDYISTAAKYTGLHPKVLQQLEYSDVFETTIQSVDRSVISDKLVYFYRVKKKIPSTHELFSALYGEIPPYVDIGEFRKILVKMGFVWQRVSKTGAVVIENPLVRFERYNYLKKIQFYRSSDCDIYYIDSGAFDSVGNYIDSGAFDSVGNFRDSKLAKKVVPVHGDWAQKVVYALGPEGIFSMGDINAFSTDEIVEWMRDTVLPKINTPSVFVLKNVEHHNAKLVDVPTLDSLKRDTVRWLDMHGVTYDPMMSKYELYALAEKLTDLTTELFKIDELVKVNGHATLRIPKCIENLTSAALLYRAVNVSEILEGMRSRNSDSDEDRKALFKDLISNAAASCIDEFERHTAAHEARLLEMEDNVDAVFETLMAEAKTAKDNEDLDSDLPSCSDSDE